MAGDATFRIDEFLEAMVAQLDRTQDALAFKAVNRPLTYAIKEFNLQLQVFVDLEADGNVRLRSAGPNEVGASTMSIAFTTITRPMIEENTVSLAASRAPSLADAGFAPAERKRLERLGVSNTAQLRRLGSTTGAGIVARLTEIPVDRLRTALEFGQPQVTGVHPVGPQPPAAPAPVYNSGPAPGPVLIAGEAPAFTARPAEPATPDPVPGGLIRGAPLIRLAPDTTHVQVIGSALATDEGALELRLNGRPVAASEADWDRVVVPVPPDLVSGTLEVTLPDGSSSRYELARELAPGNGRPATAGHIPADWRPEVE